MFSMGSLQKATLRVVEGDAAVRELRFRYNPAELSTSKSASWSRPQAAGASTASAPQYTGPNPLSVTMELVFDGWEDEGADVSRHIKTLLDWMNPPEGATGRLAHPPMLRFEWGTSRILQGWKCFLKQVSAKYTLFSSDGTPIRATCQISLEEVPQDPPPTNPTSGSRESRRSRLLDEGDSLQNAAYREYGDPNLWRGLAEFNGIDDPLRVPAGTRILVPSLAEAKRLAKGE